MWCSIVVSDLKALLHRWHRYSFNGLTRVWVFLCSSSWSTLKKPIWQCWHLCSFLLVWINTCSFRNFSLGNTLSQVGQLKQLWWTALFMWCSRCSLHSNVFSHNSHLNGLSTTTKGKCSKFSAFLPEHNLWLTCAYSPASKISLKIRSAGYFGGFADKDMPSMVQICPSST